jgi:hypothetical protein
MPHRPNADSTADHAGWLVYSLHQCLELSVHLSAEVQGRFCSSPALSNIIGDVSKSNYASTSTIWPLFDACKCVVWSRVTVDSRTYAPVHKALDRSHPSRRSESCKPEIGTWRRQESDQSTSIGRRKPAQSQLHQSVLGPGDDALDVEDDTQQSCPQQAKCWMVSKARRCLPDKRRRVGDLGDLPNDAGKRGKLLSTENMALGGESRCWNHRVAQPFFEMEKERKLVDICRSKRSVLFQFQRCSPNTARMPQYHDSAGRCNLEDEHWPFATIITLYFHQLSCSSVHGQKARVLPLSQVTSRFFGPPTSQASIS